MGRPVHYSTEIASRCQRLIERLVQQVEDDAVLAEEFRGPLRTTFLLAMSTPMIVLPMERLYKASVGLPGVADDTKLDAAVDDRVHTTFENTKFGDSPFFCDGEWSYVEAMPYFPVADVWPWEAFDKLDSAYVSKEAATAPTKDVVGCLRNALSHGGIAYLDRRGRHSEDATKMLGFASYPSIRRKAELRLLRITVDGFQTLLGLWSRWLTDNGIALALTTRGPGWFDATS